MKMALCETIARMSRLHVPVIIAFLVGAMIGVATGPRTQVMYYNAIFAWWPESPTGLRAGLRLADSDLGRQSLRRHMLSRDPAAREFAILQLVHSEMPWNLLSWGWEKIPKTHMWERLWLLGAADYAEQHGHILVGLCMEMRDGHGALVRAEAERILESFKDAEAEAEAACRRMSSRKGRGAGAD